MAKTFRCDACKKITDRCCVFTAQGNRSFMPATYHLCIECNRVLIDGVSRDLGLFDSFATRPAAAHQEGSGE